MKHPHLLILFALLSLTASAQTGDISVDKQGVLRYKNTKQEAAFFGVNYTLPFAYAYRSHQELGVDWKKAIDQDVYHLSRLGVDAFRVHVWDTEITDTLGNLLENEHLHLYDYLLFKLKERGIKTIITPIAFWGNGYPEKDEKTLGFSSIYPKRKALVNENAIKAQENYLQQFFKHINPYTRLAYGNDPDMLAVEINNEPQHSGPKAKVTEYINRLAQAIRSTGWTKPVFYNISESPNYADAVSKSNIDGVSFQWYPTGLVAGHEQKGNYLPNVDRYAIPFGDTIAAYANKARMVYEFDAADVLGPYMYPAMARSFRTAGFQWATQFAYDPLATAYANTEYQTHYLNLAYTPSKAISLLIASKVFHQIPRGKNYGSYPMDTLFSDFRVSYAESLSEMNSEQEFYYSNSTNTRPINTSKLQHIAGVGSSPVVNYTGYGAYFLDQLESGVWRLEVMPDAIFVRDPFEKASLQKVVSAIEWQAQAMSLQLPDLGTDFEVQALNTGNTYTTSIKEAHFTIRPGTYLLRKKGVSTNRWTAQTRFGTLQIGEFVAPQPTPPSVEIVHTPYAEVSAGQPFLIRATITGIYSGDIITLYINKCYGDYKTIIMQRSQKSNDFQALVPAELVTPGLLNYSIIIQKSSGEYRRFPGGYVGQPFAWDNYHQEQWQTLVANERGNLELYKADKDRTTVNLLMPGGWRPNAIQYVTTEKGELALRMSVDKLLEKQVVGIQYFCGQKIAGRKVELSASKKLMLQARTGNASPVPVRVALITTTGAAWVTTVNISNNQQPIEIPLNTLKPAAGLLLPRPYPGFLPLWFPVEQPGNFDISTMEKIEISIGTDYPANVLNQAYSLEIESLWLVK